MERPPKMPLEETGLDIGRFHSLGVKVSCTAKQLECAKSLVDVRDVDLDIRQVLKIKGDFGQSNRAALSHQWQKQRPAVDESFDQEKLSVTALATYICETCQWKVKLEDPLQRALEQKHRNDLLAECKRSGTESDQDKVTVRVSPLFAKELQEVIKVYEARALKSMLARS
eukprot:GEMP01039900.1.p1 GENE.GEMP01039900.1~~GEMP01039900.1.p1  ORF type:complete len:170 (+),score=49.11 GEMP01039900.1:133-642(+)